MKKTNHLEGNRQTILLRVILFIGVFIFMLSSVNALSITTRDDGLEYPTILVKNGGTTLGELKLLENSKECLTECYAVIEAKLNTNYKIPDTFDFVDKLGLSKNLSYQVFLQQYKNYTIQQTNSTNCIGEMNNQTCDNTYWNKTILNVPYWDNNFLIGGTRNAGTYRIKIVGHKNPQDSIDWAFSFNGDGILSSTIRQHWAWWDSSWTRKKIIYLNTTNTASIGNQSVLINVTYDSDMQSDFDDIRFLNASENAELGYWKYNNTCYDSSSCRFYVRLPQNWSATDNQTIYMYYGYASADTTSNIENAFQFADDFNASMDWTIKWASSDQAKYVTGGNVLNLTSHGTPNNKLSIKSGAIPTNFNFVWESRFKGSSTALDLYFLPSEDAVGTFDGSETLRFGAVAGGNTFKIDIQSGTPTTSAKGGENNTYYIARWKNSGSRYYANITNETEKQITALDGTTGDYTGYIGVLPNIAGHTGFIDWTFMRPYVATEPVETFGAEETSSGGTLSVNFNYPSNNTNTTDNTPTLACNFTTTGTINISNIKIIVSDSSNNKDYENVTSPLTIKSSNSTWTTSSLTDDTYKWACYGYGTEGVNGSTTSNYTLFIDATAPTLTDAPNQSSFVSNSLPFNWVLNYTAIDSAGRLDKCWEFTSDDHTNVTNTCNTNVNLQFNTYGTKTIYYFANDTFGNLASKTAIISISNDTYSQSVDSTTMIRTSTANFNLSLTSLNISNATAYLYYDGIIYLSNKTYSNATYFVSNYSITINTADVNPWFWEYSKNGSEWVNTSLQNHTIYDLTMQRINATNNVTFINFNIRDVDTLDIIANVSFDVTFNYSWFNLNNNISFDLSDSGVYNFSFFPTYVEDINLTGTITFSKTGYSSNTYNVNLLLTNSTTSVDLYLTTGATLTLFQVQDSFQSPLEDYEIQILRYFPGTNTYQLVTSLTTNFEGQDIAYLTWYTAYYKFLIYNTTNSLIQTITPTKIFNTPITINVVNTQQFVYDEFNNVAYLLTYNNNSKTFTLTYSDSGSKISSGCLRVGKRGLNDTTLNETCSTSSAATLFYTIQNNSFGLYYATFYATGSPWYTYGTIYANYEDITTSIRENLDKPDGLLLTIIITGTIAFMGLLISPVTSIILLFVGMFISASFGFYAIDIPIFVGIVIVGLIVIWSMKREP